MNKTEELLENLIVVKRDGKKVDFDCTKIALAIKKGFDSIISNSSSDEEIGEKKYTDLCGVAETGRRTS